MKTALNQLEEWILKFEKVNGTPTMCEIKAQIEMFKKVEKEQIIEAYDKGFEDVNGEIYYKETFIYNAE